MGADDIIFVALVGTNPRDHSTHAIANTLDELAPNNTRVTVLPSVGNLAYYVEDLEDAAFSAEAVAMSAAIADADAVVIVTPEYNQSIPATLKNALDWLSRLPSRPLAGKPIALQTTSREMFGGLRAQVHLRQILLSIDAHVLNKPEIFIPHVEDKVDSQTGTLRDLKTRQSISAQLESLARFVIERRQRTAPSAVSQN